MKTSGIRVVSSNDSFSSSSETSKAVFNKQFQTPSKPETEQFQETKYKKKQPQENIQKIKTRNQKTSIQRLQNNSRNISSQSIEEENEQIVQNTKKRHQLGRKNRKIAQHQQYLLRKALKQKSSQRQEIKKELLNVKMEDDSSKIKFQSMRKYLLSRDQSERLINIFSRNEGDYIQIERQMPQLSRQKIRSHLKFLFHRNMDIILLDKRQRSEGEIKAWSKEERTEIIRELLRIRATNRLLSQTSIAFREYFHTLMHSYNDPTLVLDSHRLELLYRKIDTFVRGFSTKHSARHSQVSKKEHKTQETSQAKLESAIVLSEKHMFNKQTEAIIVKREQKQTIKRQVSEDQIIKALKQWTEQEQAYLLTLFSSQISFYNERDMIKSMIHTFGNKQCWDRTDLFNQKITQMAKKGLCKLYDEAMKKQQFERITDQTEMNSYQQSIWREDRQCDIGLFNHFNELLQKISGPYHISKSKVRTSLIKLLQKESLTQESIAEIAKKLKMFLNFCQLQDLKSTMIHVRTHQEGSLKQCGQKNARLKVQQESDQPQKMQEEHSFFEESD